MFYLRLIVPPYSHFFNFYDVASFLAASFLASPTFSLSSLFRSLFVCLCSIGSSFFPSLSSLLLASSSISLTFRIASSRVGISCPCLLASFILNLLIDLPRAADRISFSNRCRTRIAIRSSSVRTGGRSSTGGPKGATICVTTCRIDFEVRQPEAMETTSPSTREELGSATMCVVYEGKACKLC